LQSLSQAFGTNLITKEIKMKLKDNVALVTGGSRGIGRAISRSLAKEGAAVVIHYRTQDREAESLKEEIQQWGGIAKTVKADLSDAAGAEHLIEMIDKEFGRLNILVNNAGQPAFGTLDSASLQDFDRVFSINVRGTFAVTKLSLDVLQDCGRIINISSTTSKARIGGYSIYGGSKACIEAFTRMWAIELAPRGITVNSVSPGLTDTELLRENMPDEQLTKIAAGMPMGRIGKPEDIADVVAFLSTEEARWITGQDIIASGGA